MKINWEYPKKVGLTLVVASVLGSYPLLRWGTPDVIAAVLAGAAIATVNVLLGFASIDYCQGKSTLTYFKVVIGGMGIRLLLMCGALVLLLFGFTMNTAALIWSLGFFYMVFLIMEVLYIQSSVQSKQQG